MTTEEGRWLEGLDPQTERERRDDFYSERLTDDEREALGTAFDHNPEASGDWVITRKEWRQLFAAVERIVAERVRQAEANALRAAADALVLRAPDGRRQGTSLVGDYWLRDRADQYDRTEA